MQLVWAVKYRQALISEEIREDVQRHVTHYFQKYGHEVIAIFCMPDHIHVLFKYYPTQAVSLLVQIAKSESTKVTKRITRSDIMDWQDGYALFTYSTDAVPGVKRYILRQRDHHDPARTFVGELRRALEDAGEVFERKYFFTMPVDWEGE